MRIPIVPHKWLIIETENKYRIFSTWDSKFLISKEKWKVNSEIVDVDEAQDYYTFTGRSGAKYKCKKDSYGTTNNGQYLLSKWIQEIDQKKASPFNIMNKKEFDQWVGGFAT